MLRLLARLVGVGRRGSAAVLTADRGGDWWFTVAVVAVVMVVPASIVAAAAWILGAPL